MRPLDQASRDEVKVAASIPIACRYCGMTDGLVIDMERGPAVYMREAPPIASPLAGYWIPHTCPRCHRTVLLPAEPQP